MSFLFGCAEKNRLHAVLDVPNNFSFISGLKVNFDLKKVIWIGA